jgi:hypothetical protein
MATVPAKFRSASDFSLLLRGILSCRKLRSCRHSLARLALLLLRISRNTNRPRCGLSTSGPEPLAVRPCRCYDCTVSKPSSPNASPPPRSIRCHRRRLPTWLRPSQPGAARPPSPRTLRAAPRRNRCGVPPSCLRPLGHHWPSSNLPPALPSHRGQGSALRGARQHSGNLLIQPHFSLLLHTHGGRGSIPVIL